MHVLEDCSQENSAIIQHRNIMWFWSIHCQQNGICGNMRQRSEQEDGTRRYRMADAANLPKDVVLGVPILTLTGHYEVNIENYRGILEYTEQLIRINVRSGQIRITGKSLEINYYTTTDMKITGKVEKIEYS